MAIGERFVATAARFPSEESPSPLQTLPIADPDLESPFMDRSDQPNVLKKAGVYPLIDQGEHFIPGTWNFGTVALGTMQVRAYGYVHGIVRGKRDDMGDGKTVEARFYATSFHGDRVLEALSTERTISPFSGREETVIRVNFTPAQAAEITFSDFDEVDNIRNFPVERQVFPQTA